MSEKPDNTKQDEILTRLGALGDQFGELARGLEGLTKAIKESVTHPMYVMNTTHHQYGDFNQEADAVQVGVNYDGTPYRMPASPIGPPVENTDSEKAEEAVRTVPRLMPPNGPEAYIEYSREQFPNAFAPAKKRLRIGIGIIAYNVAKELDWLIESLTSDHHDIVIYLYRHSKRGQFPVADEVAEVCENAAEKYEFSDGANSPRVKDVCYYPVEENRGLAYSWNEALITAYQRDKCDFVLLINDDIQFNSCAGVKDLDRVAEFVMQQPPDVGMVTVLGWHDHYAKYPHLMEQPWKGFGYSCFAITRSGWETVGCFDTNFRPIYFEDCDHGRRMWLAKLRLTEVKNTGIIHWGSLSNHTDEQLRVQHGKSNPRNELYYSKKWGGGPGQETFTTPFADASYGLYIAPEKHTRPYGPIYDRYDFAEVIKR